MFRNIDKLHKLQAPHYDVPKREHHFAGMQFHLFFYILLFYRCKLIILFIGIKEKMYEPSIPLTNPF